MEPVEIDNSATTSNPQQPGRSVNIRGVPLDDVMQAFLRRNVSYYRPVFMRMERQGTKFYGNYEALLFLPVWLVHRKFFAALVAFYLLPLAVVLTGPHPYAPPLLVALVAMAVPVTSLVFFAFGNFLLYRRFRRLILDPSLSGEQLLKHVEGKGGTSKAVLYTAAAIFALTAAIALSARLLPA